MEEVNVRCKYCEGCIYQKSFSGWGSYCDYICMEGHRRPCPPGEGCTARKTKREHQKKERTPEERAALTEMHRQRRRERDKARRQNQTPEQRERRLESCRRSYQKNKEARNAKHKEYYEANRERLNEYNKERRRKKRAEALEEPK